MFKSCLIKVSLFKCALLFVECRPFRRQLDRIGTECMPLFRMLSNAINNHLGACDGDRNAEEHVMQTEVMLAMRAVRCDILKLLQCRMARFPEPTVVSSDRFLFSYLIESVSLFLLQSILPSELLNCCFRFAQIVLLVFVFAVEGHCGEAAANCG